MPTATSEPSARPANQERVSRAILVGYALPMLGVGYMFGVLTLYLLKFATDVLLVAPGTMGLILGISRIWDAFADPLAGYLSDATRTRFGRRRPWLTASALPLGLFFVAVWSPPSQLGGATRVGWIACAVVLFYSASTSFFVPHAALGAELTTNYHERTRIFAARLIADNAGIFLAISGVFALEHSASPRLAAYRLGWMAAAITAALILTAAATLRERPEYQGRGGASPYSSFADVWKNKHARLLLSVVFVQELGFAALPTLVPYVSDYVFRTPGYTSYYLLCAFLPLTASIPIWLSASRAYGKRNVWIASRILSAVSFAGAFFVGEGDWLAIILLVALIGTAEGCGRMVSPSIQADVIDYDEYLTGERKEGSYFAAWGLVQKSAGGISAMITGFGLQFSGFRPNLEQSAATKLVLRGLFSALPFVLYSVAAALLIRFRLNEKEHARIRASLDARGAIAVIHGSR